MKKTFALILAICMAATMLAGCGNQPQQPASGNNAGSSEQGQQVTPVPSAAFPSKPITIVCGFSVGGGQDMTARTVGSAAAEFLGQAVNVKNITGSNGIPALQEALAGAHDGYTLMTLGSGQMGGMAFYETDINPIDNLTAVCRMANDPDYIAVQKGKYSSIEELVAANQADPGSVTFVNAGVGGGADLFCIAFGDLIGAQFNSVPMDGSSEMLSAVAGGIADFTCVSASSAQALVEAGMVELIACVGSERGSIYTEIPTLKELGYDVANDATAWYLVTAKDTPEDVLEILRDGFKQAMESENAITMAEKMGYTLDYADGETSNELIAESFNTFLKACEIAKTLDR